uniref:Amino acid transporter transmembrane domain-containing protein n=1 Tax=Strombidinopsis acuminata TaxID=141414 RepID=A0A7S3TFR4_9SPIT|mmetsp:Transcript_64945/g.89776  ORF Transcript_64945/g.89776 Transcript_64945/m.89776 type:complete len:192 (+) Transcript_64945:1-576(+)
MVIDSIPFGPVFQVASACLVTHMLISYLIKSVVVTKAFHNALDAANASLDTRRSWAGWNLCMLTVMVGAYLSANTIPFFADLVDLLGASVTPLSCYILPIFAYARVLFDTPSLKRKISKFEYLILILELQFSLLLIVVGTWASVQTIMDSWHTYGYPFECHCNDMWNTCACSADHAGMEYCMAPDMKPFGQ